MLRRFVAILALCLFAAAPASSQILHAPTTTPIFIGGNNGGVATTTNANTFVGTCNGGLFNNICTAVSPATARVSNFQVVSTNAPGVGQSYVVVFQIAGADTAITCTITHPATTCSDTTNSAVITAGQIYGVRFNSSATAAATNMNWGAQLR